jgi:hypothetical protein
LPRRAVREKKCGATDDPHPDFVKAKNGRKATVLHYGAAPRLRKQTKKKKTAGPMGRPTKARKNF